MAGASTEASVARLRALRQLVGAWRTAGYGVRHRRSMPDWKAMLAAVQEECLTAIWSRGVALARGEAVAGDDHDEREWNFRVRVEGDRLSPTVRLYPSDLEWDCDCESPTEPCEHVAACAISAARIGGDLGELYSGESSASWTVSYTHLRAHET